MTVLKTDTYVVFYCLILGQWREASSKLRRKYNSAPIVKVESKHELLSCETNSGRVRKFQVTVKVTGDYAYTVGYLDTLAEVSGIQSFRDGSGLTWKVEL